MPALLERIIKGLLRLSKNPNDHQLCIIDIYRLIAIKELSLDEFVEKIQEIQNITNNAIEFNNFKRLKNYQELNFLEKKLLLLSVKLVYINTIQISALLKIFHDENEEIIIDCSSKDQIKEDIEQDSSVEDILEIDEVQSQNSDSTNESISYEGIIVPNLKNFDELMDYLGKSYISSSSKKSKTDKFDYDSISETLLGTPTAEDNLSKQHASLMTPKRPFLETCNDKNHADQVAMVSKFECIPDHDSIFQNGNKNNNNQLLQIKMTIDQKQFNKLSNSIKNCVNSKIHLVPYIKCSRKYSRNNKAPFTNAWAGVNTDITQGDCSYLDTCFKWDECKYIHYHTMIPENELDKQLIKSEKHNKEIESVNKKKLYNWKESWSYALKKNLPSQWIKCDVYNIDMRIFGKFGAIIVDPAWSIHMELQFNQIDDTKVISTPVDILQDEGIIVIWVTGRSYETGKRCLINWGYDYVHEIIWAKTNQLNRTICTGRTGHWLNHSKEHALIGLKGNPSWLSRNIDVDVIVASAREASRKPDELYGMVERMVGPTCRKLELFGRQHNTRPGWFTIGDQLDGDNIYEEEVALNYKIWKSLHGN